MHAWFVDVSAWAPATPPWERALALLPAHEQRKVQKFVFAKDQKLALASRLLQWQLIRSVTHLPWAEIQIARTPEGKPYWQRPSAAAAKVPMHWNYNVSHHGTMVAIAAHPQCLIGVDVMQLSERPRRRPQDASSAHFFRAFTDHFTPLEWQYIRRRSDEEAQFHTFYRLWSLKEAYIKAIGIGLGFQLLRAEFSSVDVTECAWTMRLDGEIASQWTFRSEQVQGATNGELHFISVALGPVSDIWNSTTSSIFPADAMLSSPTSSNTEDDDSLRDLQWKETTLDELVQM